MTVRLLTARNVAEQLGLTCETVLAWVRDGKLPAFRLPSGQIRFRETDLDLWLEQRSTRVEDSAHAIARRGEP